MFRPDVLHLHEPLVPGPTSAALLGSEVPEVGTFHAASEAGHTAYKALRKIAVSAAKRLAVRVAVSPDARAHGRGRRSAAPTSCSRTASTSTRSRRPSRAVGDRPSVLFLGRHEPRKGLGVLLDAWAGLDRDADALGRVRRARDRGAPGAPRPRRRVARTDHRSREDRAAAGRDGVLRAGARAGVVRRRAARGDGRGHVRAGLGHRRYRNVARHDATRWWCRPTTPRRCGAGLRRLLDARRSPRSARRGRARPGRRVLAGPAWPSATSRSTSRRSAPRSSRSGSA